MTNAGIGGSDVLDMMLEAAENRFVTCRTPTSIEMLTDNGSAYTARERRIFARQIGLKSCFTPVKSPQSNGISEAFVHTLKRDYGPQWLCRGVLSATRRYFTANSSTAPSPIWPVFSR